MKLLYVIVFGGSLGAFRFNIVYIMLFESVIPTFILPDEELFVGVVVRMTSMRDSPCRVRLVVRIVRD